MKPENSITLEGERACEWLFSKISFINKKWWSVELLFQEGHLDSTGRERDGVQDYFILNFYRTRFRFFGRSESASIIFRADEIKAVDFRVGHDNSIFGAADYRIYIFLGDRGSIEIFHTPPLYGVTPIADARLSEGITFRPNLSIGMANAGKIKASLQTDNQIGC